MVKRQPTAKLVTERARLNGRAIWLALDAPAYIVAERLNVSGGLDRD